MAQPNRIVRTLYAQELNEGELLDRPGVVGVATGPRMKGGEYTSQTCVQVFVSRKLRRDQIPPRELLPEKLPGWEGEMVPTDVVEITLPTAEQDTTRYRPVPGGCSIGPEASVSAGTLGGYACDNTDNSIVLLSNNHVISGLDAMPAAGRIVQPGRFDGGVLPGDVIGTLKRHVPVFHIANPPPAGTMPPLSVVDAAIGTVDAARTDNVLQIGNAIYELGAPAIGTAVQKRGRTTGLTQNATINSINGTFNVTYRGATRLGRVANTFVNRSTDGNAFSGAGDSGSLIFAQARGQVNNTFPVLGLHYAGGAFADGTPMSLACDINAVFGALNLTTVCNCVVRALIRAWLGNDPGRASEIKAITLKERQLRALREQVRQSKIGSGLDEIVTREAATLSSILLRDPRAFGLAVRALEPLLRRRTVLEMLETEIDAETAENLTKLITIVSRQVKDRKLKAQLGQIGEMIKATTGSTLEALLGG